MSVTIDGSSGVTVNGTKLVAAAPMFSAYNSAMQSVTKATYTKVTLDTEEFDTNNNFASSRFTPTVPGYYQINGQVYGYGTTTATVIAVLYKNGSAYVYGSFAAANSSTNAVSTVSTVVYMNGTTDYIELWGYVDAITSPNFPATSGGIGCRLSGCLVRGT